MTEKKRLPFYIILSLLSWASAYPVVRLALRDIPPLPLAALRYFIAACVAGLWLVWKKPVLPGRREFPRLFVCGAFGIAAYNILFNLGEQTVSSGATSLIIASAPIMAGIMAVLCAGESLSLFGWIGSLVSFGGVTLIVMGQKGGLTFGSGAGLELLAAFCTASYVVLQRPLVQRYGGLTVTACVLMIGAFLLLPWLKEGSVILYQAPRRAWLCVFELAILPAAIGYAAWSHVIGIMGAARGTLLLYLLPPLTFVMAFILEGSWPDWTTWCGGAVVMSGVILAHKKTRRSI
ncbi:EamA family transporter [Acetobacteraceae bacterium ESL0709]|nr:EamA family transporter [Acetobacteraceae bacterium ESL0697]MDF7677221.1 EamA family transporter [Acetobacteraceae bacterium ESL0709]